MMIVLWLICNLSSISSCYTMAYLTSPIKTCEGLEILAQYSNIKEYCFSANPEAILSALRTSKGRAFIKERVFNNTQNLHFLDRISSAREQYLMVAGLCSNQALCECNNPSQNRLLTKMCNYIQRVYSKKLIQESNPITFFSFPATWVCNATDRSILATQLKREKMRTIALNKIENLSPDKFKAYQSTMTTLKDQFHAEHDENGIYIATTILKLFERADESPSEKINRIIDAVL